MSDKPKITKNIETRVEFTNEQVKAILLKVAGAPEDAQSSIVQIDGDSFYGDLEIVWWTKEVSEPTP